MTTASAHVAIIVLNYNGWEDTKACLESVIALEYADFSVFVVDNNSCGDDAHRIDRLLAGAFGVREEIEVKGTLKYEAIRYSGADGGSFSRVGRGRIQAFLLLNHKNYGFTRGNNMAIELALASVDPEFVMLLNNDVTLEPDSLAVLIAFAGSSRKVGAVQPRILSKSENGIVDSLGQAVYRNGRAKDMGQGERDPGPFGNIEVFGTCAAAALYRVEALSDTGLLDERFFIALEDVDLAWRLRLCGYASYCVSQAVAYHCRGITGSRRIWEGIDPVRSYNKNKNHFLLILKYYSAASIIRYAHINAFRFLSALLSGAILHRNFPAVLRGSIKERKEMRRKYPNMGMVRERWLMKE